MDGIYLVSTSTNPTTKGAASDFLSSEVMYCMACFDVKKAEEELKEGHKGIGACMQRIGTKVYNDANFFGSIEAQGSDSFRFNEDSKNDWDTDSGYLGDTSNIYYDWDVGGDAVKDIYYLTAEFVSEPLDVNANSPKNLGIWKAETYWKCYVGEHDKIESSSPFETDISLSKFTTDVPRWIDTTGIEDAASQIVLGVAVFIALLF